MKQLLLTAGACIGLFAFTRVGVSHVQSIATVKQGIQTDTTNKPKPDSIRSVSFIDAAQMDTTNKPKPDSNRASAFVGVAQTDTTNKPKPDSLRLAML